MDHEQMKSRCPRARFIVRTFLKDYKFVYDGTSDIPQEIYANILKSKGEIVWGGLFEIDEKCLEVLDDYEDYPEFYQRGTFTIQDDQGGNYQATAYYATLGVSGVPTNEYRKVILQGARDCQLPEDYIMRWLR